MFLAQVLAGGLLLAFGHRLFWLFVAACGFAAGLILTTRLITTQPAWLALIMALAIGALAALLAIFFQRLAVGVAGFLAGALIAGNLFDAFGLQAVAFFWLAFVVGGILGAILMEILFDWGLIALSSLAGSSLIVEALRLPAPSGFLLWAVLLGLGIAVQVTHMRREDRLPKKQGA